VSVKKGDSLSVSVSKKARCKMENGRMEQNKSARVYYRAGTKGEMTMFPDV